MAFERNDYKNPFGIIRDRAGFISHLEGAVCPDKNIYDNFQTKLMASFGEGRK